MEKTMGGDAAVAPKKPVHPDDPPDTFSGEYDIHELVEKKRFDKLRTLFGSNLIIG